MSAETERTDRAVNALLAKMPHWLRAEWAPMVRELVEALRAELRCPGQ